MSVLPRWGLVSAAPHEFLVHLRRGEVVTAKQGGSCFRWPGDTVALVDTSVHRLSFTADQITREKTGVEVTGLAVVRIVEPLLAYRMLNLQAPDQHLRILEEMLRGATRRLVANLTLDDCLTRRKDALADELLEEIAPIVGGAGAVDDGTHTGWGVAIDTIEVQDVRVLSNDVFAKLQSTYRQSLAREALEAEAAVEARRAELQEAGDREAERRRRELLALQEARVAEQRRRQLEQVDHEAAVAQRKLEDALAQKAREAEAEHALREARRAGDLADATHALEVARHDAESTRLRGLTAAEVHAAQRAALDVVSPARLQEVLYTETLPEVARAFADSFDRIVVTGASDLSVLGQGVGQVVSTLQALGVGLPGVDAAG